MIRDAGPAELDRVISRRTLNGSGSRDIVWGNAGDYRFLDLTGGLRPRLLEVVHNGLGGTTHIFYRTSVDSMVDDAAAGRPWSSTAPMAVTVVAGTVTSDGLGWYGETEYEYRDAVYDGLEAEFRGFRQALARSIGDAHTPTAVALSWFRTGERPEWLCAGLESRQECALLDNPLEALKGSELLSETRADPDMDADPWSPGAAASLSTSQGSATVDQLYEGLDGRGVWLSWSEQSDGFQYGHDDWEPGSHDVEVPSLRVRRRLPDAAEEELHAESATLRLRSTAANTAHIRSTRQIDRFGRTLVEQTEGLVGVAGDEVTRRTSWAMNPSAWIHRPCEAWVEGGPSDASERLGWTQTFYDDLNDEPSLCTVGDRGLATYNRVHLVTRDQLGVPMTPGRWLPQEVMAYNEQGQMTESWSGEAPGSTDSALRRAQRLYDADYSVGVVQERILANRPGAAELWLETRAEWDTNLGALTTLEDFNGERSHVLYDRLGRIEATYRPLCAEPSVVHEYHLDPRGSLHWVHTRVNEVCDAATDPAAPDATTDPLSQLQTATGVQDAWAYTDGMGRVRATVSEDDVEGSCILSGVALLDARGEVWRAYEPERIGACGLLSASALSGSSASSAISQRDAFGRERWSSVLGDDATAAHLTAHGVRWTRVFDGNDLYEPGFEDTPTITLVDGQGRTVRAMTLSDPASATSVAMVETTYDALGNLLALERGAGELASEGSTNASFVAGQTTRRELLYDSLGRRTHNLDPDSGTSLYFYDRFGELTRFVDARGAESRFVYDLGGRLIAEDHGLLYGADGAAWITPGSNGHSPDDDAGLARLEELIGQLWGDFQRDTNGDFIPEVGADVLYGFDSDYIHDLSLCARRGLRLMPIG